MNIPTTARLINCSEDVQRAADFLRSGALVALPTETVYGLAADATNGHAVAAIYAAKSRPQFNPLIVHCADIEMARQFGEVEGAAALLAEAFWPGPLTLVVPQRAGRIADLVTAGLPTVALRVPDHPVAQAVIRAAGCPLAAPSANPSGQLSPTEAGHVLAGLDGKIAAVLDAGPTEIGVESTIVGAGAPPRLLRPGGISLEAIEAVLGCELATAMPEVDRPTSPGQLASHYAPNAALRLEAADAQGDEVLLGFGGTPGATLDLSPRGDLAEAAARLFGALHQLDAMGRPIAVAPIPRDGLGLAINDRLQRAAAPRD